MIIPPRATSVVSDTAETAPSPRDRHIQMIAERGRLGWQRAVQYGRRSLVEVAMLKYKVLIGRSLRARSARTEGRGPSRLCRHQPDDRSRYARLQEDRLTVTQDRASFT